MKRDEFLAVYDAAKVGDEIQYHFGSLMFDRVAGPTFPEVDCLARTVWAMMEEGKVRLVQRRSKPTGNTKYFAIKLPVPHKPVEWEGCYATDNFYTKSAARKKAVAMGAALARQHAAGPIAPHA